MFRFLSILICGCCIVADAQVSSNWFQKGSAIALDNASSFDMSFSGDGNSIALVGVSSSDEHAKVYSLQPTYDVTFSASEGGSINIPNGSYPLGTNITLSVTPESEAWLFTGWSGDFIGDHTTSNATITISTNMSITANFSLDADGDGLSNLLEKSLNSYSIIEASLTWEQARDDAISRGGHLATITSASEWETVLAMMEDFDPSRNYWLGGKSILGNDQWTWITNEPWDFEDWQNETPVPTEDNLYLVGHCNDGGVWYVRKNDDTSSVFTYILEIENNGIGTDPYNSDSDGDGLNDSDEINVHGTNPNTSDSDNDGLTDFDEINNGSNPLVNNLDEDGDGISNSDEQILGTNPFNSDSDGDGLSDLRETSNQYEYIAGSFDWYEARDDAITRGGHLATITSTNEWTIIDALDADSPVWLGGTDENTEGQWEWVTGEPWSVEFWDERALNNGTLENHLLSRFWDSELWNDNKSVNNYPYILEISSTNTDPLLSDSDSDGLSDYEESISGGIYWGSWDDVDIYFENGIESSQNLINPDKRVDAIAVNTNGDIYVSTYDEVLKVSSSGESEIFVDSSTLSSYGINRLARGGLAFDALGNLFFTGNGIILKVNENKDITVFGKILVENGRANNLTGLECCLTFDSNNNLYAVAEQSGDIYKITPTGVLSKFWNGSSVISSIAFDSNNNLYAAQQGYASDNRLIRKITPEGIMSIFWTSPTNNDNEFLNALVVDNQDNIYTGLGDKIIKIDTLGNASDFVVNLSGTISAMGNLIIPNTNPNNPDSDGDGLNDGDEIDLGTNPNNPDSDGDGLDDSVETNTGTYVSTSNTGTNPSASDTDGDNLSDGAEVNIGTNPTLTDTDSDGLNDHEEYLGIITSSNVFEFIEANGSSWYEARDYAIGRGGHLATVTSLDEWNRILSVYQDANNGRAWLGATDELNENEWRWITGETWNDDITFWSGNMPDNGSTGPTSEDYLEIYVTSLWNDRANFNGQPQAGFILETYVLSTNIVNTSPINSDSDGDGLTDYQEVVTYKTDPLINADKDGDGVSDADEVTAGTDLNDDNDPIILPIISSFYSSSGTNIDLLTSIPSRQITYSVTATDNVGISSVYIPGVTQVSQTGNTFTFTETFYGNDYTYGNTAVTRTATVTDTAGNVATDSITLSITKIDNQPPSISLNSDLTSVQIRTSEQTQTITYSVTATDNTGISSVYIPGVTQGGRIGNTFTFTETFNYSDYSYGNTAVTRTATVTDTAGNVATDSITLSITKIDNQTPSISLIADDTIIELRTSEQTQTITYSVTATDNVGISSVSIPGISQGGQIGNTFTFTETFNYNDYPFGNTAVTRTARVTDNAGNLSTQTITITINRINSPPVFTSTNVFSVIENNNYIGELNATDPEEGSVTYNIVETNSISLSLDSSTGVLTFEVLPDYEQDATNYVCVFRAVDDYGLSSFTTNAINITDDRTEDFDGDGLTEAEEEDGVYGYVTSDLDADMDDDGLTDYAEVQKYTIYHNTTWSNALLYTESIIGAELAIISNTNQFNAVSNFISNADLSELPNSYLWIGGSFIDNQWEWVDGSPIDIDALPSDHNLYASSWGPLTKLVIAASNVNNSVDYKFLEFRGDNEQNNRSALLSFPSTNPNNSDTDSDGLTDFQEVITYRTNPILDADKDNDDFTDSDEVNEYGTDPSDPSSYPVWNVNISVNGDGSITPLSGTYKRGTNITFTVTEGIGYLFTGWYGDLLSDPVNMSLSTNILISTNLNIVGAFSNDADGDGLTNTEESALGSNPWLLDSDGDGIDDPTETTMTNMVFTFNPTVNSQSEIDRFRDMLENIPGMNENSTMDLKGGDIELSIENNIATIRIPLQASTDGGNNWIDTTNVIETTYSTTNSSGFFEMEFE